MQLSMMRKICVERKLVEEVVLAVLRVLYQAVWCREVEACDCWEYQEDPSRIHDIHLHTCDHPAGASCQSVSVSASWLSSPSSLSSFAPYFLSCPAHPAQEQHWCHYHHQPSLLISLSQYHISLLQCHYVIINCSVCVNTEGWITTVTRYPRHCTSHSTLPVLHSTAVQSRYNTRGSYVPAGSSSIWPDTDSPFTNALKLLVSQATDKQWSKLAAWSDYMYQLIYVNCKEPSNYGDRDGCEDQQAGTICHQSSPITNNEWLWKPVTAVIFRKCAWSRDGHVTVVFPVSPSVERSALVDCQIVTEQLKQTGYCFAAAYIMSPSLCLSNGEVLISCQHLI